MLNKLIESIENEWDARQNFSGYGKDVEDKDIDAGAKAIIAKVEKGLGLKKASVKGQAYPMTVGQKEVPVSYMVTFQSPTGANLLKLNVSRPDGDSKDWNISDIITPCTTRILTDMIKII